MCGNDFEITVSQQNYETSKYCSKKCAHKKGYYSSHEKKYPKTAYLRQIVFLKWQREGLSDSYIRALIKDLPAKDIPQELIELKRLNIKRKRKLKEITHGNSQ